MATVLTTSSALKERYLQYEAAGDCAVGRTATGMNVMDKEFAASPPYFDGGDDVQSAVDNIAFATKPDETVLKSAVVRYPWNKTDKTPNFTGIPPHVAIMCKLEGLEQTMKEVQANLAGLPEQISALPGKIIENIGEGRDIVVHNHGGGGDGDGGDPRLVQKVEEMAAYFQQMREGGSTDTGSNGQEGATAMNGGRDGLPPLFRWPDGSLHRLPENYMFPKGLILKSFIREYIIGSTGRPGGDIPPFRVLTAKDVAHVVNSKGKAGGARKRISDMRRLMVKVEEIGRREGLWKGNASRHWEVEDCSKLHDAVMKEFYPDDGSNKKKRKLEISWNAVYNDRIKKSKKNN